MAQTSPDAAEILPYTKLLGVSAVNDPHCCVRYLLANLMAFGKHAPYVYSGVVDMYRQVQAEGMLHLRVKLPSKRMLLISKAFPGIPLLIVIREKPSEQKSVGVYYFKLA